MEVWKDIAGYEGLYQVSNKGNIYSVEREDSRGNKCGGRTLKTTHNSKGYLKLDLSKNGIKKTRTVHRLVAQAFIPNQNNYLEINHKDENKTNNNVENLEWCTSKYNNNHGTAIKRRVQSNSKRIKAVNVETGEVTTFSSTAEARRKGYHSGGVSSACRGVYKSGSGKLIGGGNLYKGHKWYYI